MKFLVDNQLPPALARLIQAELGHEAVHVADVGLRDAGDADLWRYASERGLVLISKDEDFTSMSLQQPGPCFIWVRIGNCRRASLLDAFRRVWPRLLTRLESGDEIIELW